MTDAQSIARSAQRITLTAANWAEAALDAIAENGIEAVAVEPLARRLGVTKGSFYWHFTHREALQDLRRLQPVERRPAHARHRAHLRRHVALQEEVGVRVVGVEAELHDDHPGEAELAAQAEEST